MFHLPRRVIGAITRKAQFHRTTSRWISASIVSCSRTRSSSLFPPAPQRGSSAFRCRVLRLPRQSVDDGLRIGCSELERCLSGTFRTAALWPILQRRDTSGNRQGKLPLGQSELIASRYYVGGLDVKRAGISHFTTPDPAGWFYAGDEFF